MKNILSNKPKWKKFLWNLASMGLYPTIIASIGFSYMAIPSNLQTEVRHYLPYDWRSTLINITTTEHWLIILLILTVLCAIWGSIGGHATTWLVTQSYNRIHDENKLLIQERDNKTIDSYDLFSHYIYDFSKRLKFTSNERISIYKLDLNIFSCIGRCSENELFNNKPNRIYTNIQGVISKAWAIGKHQDSNIPDAITDLEAWIDYNIKTYKYTREELIDTSMKSRSFLALRLRNNRNETLAVIVFESIKSDGLPFGRIERMIDDAEKKKLSLLIETMKNHIPSLEKANLEGF